MTYNQEIKVFPDAHDLFDYAAKDFMQRAISTVSDKGIFSVALSGGNTPKVFFDTLTSIDDNEKKIPWQKIQFFFGDERYVSPEARESNYRMAYQHLFSKVPIKTENIYRIPTEFADPEDAARQYEHILRKAFHMQDNTLPQFDLIYLGLGNNSHTASLMPFSGIVKHYADNKQIVTSLWVSELDMYRITLTPSVINNSRNIIFLVTGENKAIAVKNVLEESFDPERYPAQLIHSTQGETIWYLDKLAAKWISFYEK